MALDRHIARLSKMIVDGEDVSFDEAQDRLRSLTLEIRVGAEATSQAAHCAILTALAVGRRTFIGGVRVVGLLDQPLMTALPLNADSLEAAVLELGAIEFAGAPSKTISIGDTTQLDHIGAIHVWWNGWRAGASPNVIACDDGDSPLTGIAAGALGVAVAFEEFKGAATTSMDINLWPSSEAESAPPFSDIWFPDAAWIVGLGNLGQAYLWVLSSLPYRNADSVSVILQDQDRVSEENWATSILVRDEVFGDLKTRIGEEWARKRGFDVRRIDRFLTIEDRVREGEPQFALSGTDTVEARLRLADTGFACVVDAGLGRTAKNYDRLRVTLFDAERNVTEYFQDDVHPANNDPVMEAGAYQTLQDEIGQCGMAEIAGSSVAACYVSAIAACFAISRMIAVTSGYSIPQTEVLQLRNGLVRTSPLIAVSARALGHAGQPSRIHARRNAA